MTLDDLMRKNAQARNREIGSLLLDLIPAAAGLAAHRIGLGGPGGVDSDRVCLDCGGAHADPALIAHSAVCRAGQVFTILRAIIARDTDEQERSQQGEVQSAAAGPEEARRPPEDMVTKVDRVMARHGFAGADGLFFEPWLLSENGEVVNALGNVIVDPTGSTVPFEDEARYMRRIVACVNICEGLKTENIETITIRRVQDEQPTPIAQAKKGGVQ